MRSAQASIPIMSVTIQKHFAAERPRVLNVATRTVKTLLRLSGHRSAVELSMRQCLLSTKSRRSALERS